ncbi:MAG TPA: hypothetical protein ENN80_00305, partial [Candidatus Hydrogenedentes bacterium]|nr:hypothetical protein [Candidatus Hydrogenedentota bacterium]
MRRVVRRRHRAGERPRGAMRIAELQFDPRTPQMRSPFGRGIEVDEVEPAREVFVAARLEVDSGCRVVVARIGRVGRID